MRLRESDSKKIVRTLIQSLKGIKFQVYLFGSRVDNQKLGGDIDLLLIVLIEDLKKIRSMKSILKFDLQGAIGEQKIDITIATESQFATDVFLASIKDELIELN